MQYRKRNPEALQIAGGHLELILWKVQVAHGSLNTTNQCWELQVDLLKEWMTHSLTVGESGGVVFASHIRILTRCGYLTLTGRVQSIFRSHG